MESSSSVLVDAGERRVPAFFGANGAPVNSCRARDTCPLWTRLWAACPRRTLSSSSVRWDLRHATCANSDAACNNSIHRPPSKFSNLFANSSRLTEPALLGLQRRIIGTRQNGDTRLRPIRLRPAGLFELGPFDLGQFDLGQFDLGQWAFFST